MKGAGQILLICLLVFAQHVFATQEFVTVPKGSLNPFWLKPKKNNQKLIYKVKSLQVQISQVTNSDFIEFLKLNPQWTKSQVPALFAEGGYLEQFADDQTVKSGVHLLSPVTSVSWFAARAYCESIQARLPTINEWEYLAAASEKVKDANKNSKFLERILNWYGHPKEISIPQVRSIYKSLYGLHDMHGLVWEWVEDFNSSMVTGESREDTTFNRDLFCGAGSMNSGDKENYAAFMRFAFRSSLKGNSALWNLGFRCVKEASQIKSERK